MEKRKIRCTYCGAENEQGDKCLYCGKALYTPYSYLTKSEQEKLRELEYNDLRTSVRICSNSPITVSFDYVYYYDIEFKGKSSRIYEWDEAVMCTPYQARLALVCDEETFLFHPQEYMNLEGGCYALTQEQVRKICEAKEILMRFKFYGEYRHEPHKNYILSPQDIELLQTESRLLYHCKWDSSQYQEEFEKAEQRLKSREEARQADIENKKKSMRQSILDEERNKLKAIQNKEREIQQNTRNIRQALINTALICLLLLALKLLFGFGVI